MFPRVKAEAMNLAVKAAMPSRTQQQLQPGASIGGLFSGSGTTNRDAMIASLLLRLVGQGRDQNDFTRLPDLPSAVGPHTTYTHPGLGGFTRIPDLFGEGEKFTPNAATSGPKVSIHADLRGLFSGQKTGVVIPGGKGGQPNISQSNLLRAINRSTYPRGIPVGQWFDVNPAYFGQVGPGSQVRGPLGTHDIFDLKAPGVADLAEHIGAPGEFPGSNNSGYTAASNALTALLTNSGPAAGSRLGITPGKLAFPRGLTKRQRTDAFIDPAFGIGDVAAHQKFIDFLMQKNAINRRN